MGQGENFLASDALASRATNRFAFLEEGDVVEITLDGVKIVDREGAPAEREVRVVAAWRRSGIGPLPALMQKKSSGSRARHRRTIPQATSSMPLFGEGAADIPAASTVF